MKGTLLVVFQLDSQHLDSVVESALKPHRLDDSSIDSIHGRNWDYWVYHDSNIADPEVARVVQKQNATAYTHASFVRNLPDDYTASAVVDPNGVWHNIQDFGWKLTNEPSSENDAASKLWADHFAELRQMYADCVAVEVLYHC